jgi:hypothetical protein
MQSMTVNLIQPPLYPAFVASTKPTSDFHERLAALRRQRGLTRLQFEAISRFDEEEKRVVRSVLEGMILKHEVRRWQSTTSGGERK